MKIIAFGHRKNVGKDTAGKFLMDKDWVHLSFADPLKKSVSALFGLNMEYFTNQELKEENVVSWDMSPREMMIWFGCLIRNNRPGHWIRLMNHELVKCFHRGKNVVITDLRFPDEMAYLQQIGAVCVRIDRPNIPITHDKADDALEGADFDIQIMNDGNIFDLYKKVEAIQLQARPVMTSPYYIPASTDEPDMVTALIMSFLSIWLWIYIISRFM